MSFWCCISSEKGFRRRIPSICRCSSLSSYSTVPVMKIWRQPSFSSSLGGKGDSVRLPISLSPPLNLQAEGRPPGATASSAGRRLLSFLLVMEPKRRQLSFGSTSATPAGDCGWCCCSDLSAPSGFVPGDDGIGSAPKLFGRRWTTLQLEFSSWGPLCIVHGSCCNFRFLMGLWTSCMMYPEIMQRLGPSGRFSCSKIK